jgi:hypothetical protein
MKVINLPKIVAYTTLTTIAITISLFIIDLFK